MAIPTRALQATCDIDAGTLTISESVPVFTGENYATDISVTLTRSGSDYSPSGLTAELYLYWPMANRMSQAIELSASGNVLSGQLPDTLTAVSGSPLLVIQLTEPITNSLVVAASAPVRITKVRGDIVVTSRAPSPSEMIYVGRSPYIGTNGHWYEWDTEAREYVDTGVDIGTVARVNEQIPDYTGNVTVTDDHIASSAISGKTTVKAGLTYLNEKAGTHDTQIAAHDTQISTHTTQIAAHGTQLDTHTTQIGTLSGLLESFGLSVVDGQLCRT